MIPVWQDEVMHLHNPLIGKVTRKHLSKLPADFVAYAKSHWPFPTCTLKMDAKGVDFYLCYMPYPFPPRTNEQHIVNEYLGEFLMSQE